MDAWKYSKLVRSKKTSDSSKYYILTSQGYEVNKDFKNRPSGLNEEDAVGRFITSLGEDGWELVSVSWRDHDTEIWYFKHPIEFKKMD